VSAGDGGVTAGVVATAPPEAGLFDFTFGTAAEDVRRDPVLFLVAVGVALVTTNGIHPVTGATLGDLALAFAAVLLAPLVLARRPSYLTIPRWLIAAVTLIGVTVLVSTATSAAKATNFVDGVKFLIALGLTPLIIATVAASTARVVLLADIWILGAFVNAAIATSDFLGLTDIGSKLTGTKFNLYTGRSVGLSATPNHLGLIAAMAIPIALSRILSTSGRPRVAYLVAVVVLVGGILSSGSRAALVAATIGVIALPLLHPIGRRQILLGFAVAVIALGVGAAVVPSARSHIFVVVHRLTGSDPSAASSDSVRQAALKRGLSEFRAHPLTGNGYAVVRDAHDMYLQVVDAGGILALPAFLVFAGGVVLVGVRLRRERELPAVSQNLAAALTASMLVWLSCGIVSNEVYDRYLYVPAGLLLGLLFACRRSDGISMSASGIFFLLRTKSGAAAAEANTSDVRSSNGSGLSFARMRAHMTLLLASVFALGAAVVVTHSYDKSTMGSPPSLVAPSPQLVPQQEIDRYPLASPEHAMLVWWRAAQFANYASFLGGFDSRVRRKLGGAATTTQAVRAFAGFASLTAVKFVSVNRHPTRATIYADMRWYKTTPSGRVVISVFPRVFRLVREDGAWKLRDDAFFESILPSALKTRP
jgi:hypothetical protein